MMSDLFVCSAGGHFVPKDPKLQTLRNMMSVLYVCRGPREPTLARCRPTEGGVKVSKSKLWR